MISLKCIRNPLLYLIAVLSGKQTLTREIERVYSFTEMIIRAFESDNVREERMTGKKYPPPQKKMGKTVSKSKQDITLSVHFFVLSVFTFSAFRTLGIEGFRIYWRRINITTNRYYRYPLKCVRLPILQHVGHRL